MGTIYAIYDYKGNEVLVPLSDNFDGAGWAEIDELICTAPYKIASWYSLPEVFENSSVFHLVGVGYTESMTKLNPFCGM